MDPQSQQAIADLRHNISDIRCDMRNVKDNTKSELRSVKAQLATFHNNHCDMTKRFSTRREKVSKLTICVSTLKTDVSAIEGKLDKIFKVIMDTTPPRRSRWASAVRALPTKSYKFLAALAHWLRRGGVHSGGG